MVTQDQEDAPAVEVIADNTVQGVSGTYFLNELSASGSVSISHKTSKFVSQIERV